MLRSSWGERIVAKGGAAFQADADGMDAAKTRVGKEDGYEAAQHGGKSKDRNQEILQNVDVHFIYHDQPQNLLTPAGRWNWK